MSLQFLLLLRLMFCFSTKHAPQWWSTLHLSPVYLIACQNHVAVHEHCVMSPFVCCKLKPMLGKQLNQEYQSSKRTKRIIIRKMRRVGAFALSPPTAACGTAMLTQSCSISLGSKKRVSKNRDPIMDTKVTQARSEVPRLRNPGSTKVVTYTNKKGRVFHIPVPMTKITHPQRKLVSPIDGRWKALDTSYVDTGDFQDDMPTSVDELLQAPTESAGDGELAQRAAAVYHSFVKEYIEMDTNGMLNQSSLYEKNAGPSYDEEDRKTKRRRHWFTLRKRFFDVRELIWPSSVLSLSKQQATSTRHLPAVPLREMYDTLRAVKEASDFRIRAKLPYEERTPDEFEAIDLSREVRVLGRAVALHDAAVRRLSATSDESLEAFFSNNEVGFQRLLTCSALCREYGIPLSAFFSDPSYQKFACTDGASTLIAFSQFSGTFKQRLCVAAMRGLCECDLSLRSLPRHALDRCLHGFEAILQSCTKAAASSAMDSLDGDDMTTIIRFLASFRAKNQHLFAQSNSPHLSKKSKAKRSEQINTSPFAESFRFHVSAALNRCAVLLYKNRQLENVTVIEEGGMIPLIDLQQQANRFHKDVVVNHAIGVKNAEGLRVAHLSVANTSEMLRWMQELRRHDADLLSQIRGSDVFEDDMMQHLSLKLSSSHHAMSLDELVECLEVISVSLSRKARSDDATPFRLNKMLSIVDTSIGGRLDALTTLEDWTRVVQGFASCRCDPSCRLRLEAVGLRLFSSKEQNTVHVDKQLSLYAAGVEGLNDISSGYPTEHQDLIVRGGGTSAPSISLVLLEHIARSADTLVSNKPAKRGAFLGTAATEAAIRLLQGLMKAGYEGATSLLMKWRPQITPHTSRLSSLSLITYSALLLHTAEKAVREGSDAATLRSIERDSSKAFAVGVLRCPSLPPRRLLQVLTVASALSEGEAKLRQGKKALLCAVSKASLDDGEWTHLSIPELCSLLQSFISVIENVNHELVHVCTRQLLTLLAAQLDVIAKPADFQLDHKYQVTTDAVWKIRHGVVDWEALRWSSICVLGIDATSDELMQVKTLAGRLLARYIQRAEDTVALVNSANIDKGNFEMTHRAREGRREQFEADAAECRCFLERGGEAVMEAATLEYSTAAEEGVRTATAVTDSTMARAKAILDTVASLPQH